MSTGSVRKNANKKVTRLRIIAIVKVEGNILLRNLSKAVKKRIPVQFIPNILNSLKLWGNEVYFPLFLILKISIMRLLLGIDDTDNKDSRGTGFLSRLLASEIIFDKLGDISGITRHQLFVHPEIPFTSQNSSACLDVEVDEIQPVIKFVSDFLINNSAPGSDAGLAVAQYKNIPGNIVNWGIRAKNELLSLQEAREIASSSGIFIDGFTGLKIGQIGALAAVGLRKSGNDGRYIWIGGQRELRDFLEGIYSCSEIKSLLNIWKIQTKEGKFVGDKEKVLCSDWVRPVLLNDHPVLIVEEVNNRSYGYQTANKDYIRNNS